ncbi:MAG: aspartate/glutamate racemase family protein [Salinirussus sp.]
MYGWRARLGLLVPSSNTTNEPEFAAVLPDGVSLHTGRLPLEDVTADDLTAMAETAVDAAEHLAHANVDVVAYGCTTGSLVKGHGYAEELEASLADVADAPAVATALSVERALDALGARSVAVVTPYIDDLNEREREFLEEAGFEVRSLAGRGIEPNLEIGHLSPEAAYRQARSAGAEDADALFISCTNYRTFEAIEPLEADLDVPVVTSNQATLWDALRRTDIESGIDLGQLFTA